MPTFLRLLLNPKMERQIRAERRAHQLETFLAQERKKQLRDDSAQEPTEGSEHTNQEAVHRLTIK